jgi:hypothetical protein
VDDQVKRLITLEFSTIQILLSNLFPRLKIWQQ